MSLWHQSFESGMRSPGRGEHQLIVLCQQKRSKLSGKCHEVFVGKNTSPEGPSISVVIELPQVNHLIHCPNIAGEVAHELFGMFFKRWPALMLIELHHLSHLSNDDVIGSKFVNCHD